MSEIAQNAKVSILLADFARVDTEGKLNVVGGGVTGLGFDLGQGLTSRFTLVVIVWVPATLLPAECALEVYLTQAGSVVMAPGPVDSQAIRISQNVIVEPLLAFPPAARSHVGSHYTSVLDFNNGLPLAPGGMYEWNVRIDGDETQTWSLPITVAGAPGSPVLG
jgi:hypothetical protein